MSLTKNQIGDILYEAMAGDSHKKEVRLRREEYTLANEEGKRLLREKYPDFIGLYQLLDEE